MICLVLVVFSFKIVLRAFLSVQMACRALLSTMFPTIRKRRIVGLRSLTLTVTKRPPRRRNDWLPAACLAATSLLTGPTHWRNQMRRRCQRHAVSFGTVGVDPWV